MSYSISLGFSCRIRTSAEYQEVVEYTIVLAGACKHGCIQTHRLVFTSGKVTTLKDIFEEDVNVLSLDREIVIQSSLNEAKNARITV